MKILLVGADYSMRTDRRTDMMKLIVVLRSFAQTPKKRCTSPYWILTTLQSFFVYESIDGSVSDLDRTVLNYRIVVRIMRKEGIVADSDVCSGHVP